jgi:hypothetical protein
MSKLRGFRKMELLRELAMGAASRSELAEKYEVDGTRIYQISCECATEIDAIRADLMAKLHDETVGLWIASKRNRIAEYQQDVDDANAVLAKAYDHRLVADKHRALRAVAEELAQLPQRASVQVGEETVIAYTITKPQDLP